MSSGRDEGHQRRVGRNHFRRSPRAAKEDTLAPSGHGGTVGALRSSFGRKRPLTSTPSFFRRMSLPLVLALTGSPRRIGVASARATHFLSGNLSSSFELKHADYDHQYIVSSGDRDWQAFIKSETAKTIKSNLRHHFQFTGQETILPTLDDVETDSLGRLHIRFRQYIDGLPIEGASLMAHVDPGSGTLIAINGEFHSAATTEVKVRSTEMKCEAALTIAVQEHGVSTGEWQSDCTSAVVQGRDGKAHRAFKRLFGYQPAGAGDPFQLDVIFADRLTGKLLSVHPQVMGVRSINTFDCRRRVGGPSDCKIFSSSPGKISSKKKAARDAHNYAVDAYDFYKQYFDRDSFDGKGGTILSFTNFGPFYNNAFYSSAFGGMVYGNGDGVDYNPFSTAFDVVVHEYTHGITFSTSNLVYMGESGALNEAISDIFGATAERIVRRKSRNKVWMIGEKVVRARNKAIRNMANPPEYDDPDHYADRYLGAEDNFGVHINSGIINKAFVLMVQGGVHAVSNIAVPALSSDFDSSILEAARIFYDANTKCLSANSDFLMARQCTLMFASSAQAEVVSKAWDAVGVVESASAWACVAINGRCSPRKTCCGKNLTCTGPKGRRFCSKCKQEGRRCIVGTECCRLLKCKHNRCTR